MSREVGTPIVTSQRVQVGLAVNVFRSIADAMADLPLESRIGTSVLLIASRPASSRRSRRGTTRSTSSPPSWRRRWPPGARPCSSPPVPRPLAAFVLAEIIDELELPPGTVNIVTGPGSEIGDLMAAHPGVDMVSITGSTRAGISVAKRAARDGQAGHPRTRRQVGVPAARRHRSVRRAAGRGAQLLRQQRADLLRPHPARRAARATRRGAGRARRPRRGDARGRPARHRHRTRADGVRRSARHGPRVHRPGPSPRVPPSSPAARRPRTGSSAVSTCGPPSSPTSTRRW